MSGPSQSGGQVIEGKADLVRYLEDGCKPREQWRIGTEHEKLLFRHADLRRPSYEEPQGIRALLEGLTRFGWQPIRENDLTIALRRDDGSTISLEPGGQLELSGAMLENIHQTCEEVHEHLDQIRIVGAELGLGALGMGFDPKWPRDQIPWMPRERHAIMRRYMPRRGGLGLDMMLRTCTIQANLDFSSEADMVRKLRVSFALQPIVTALFANSPFADGRYTGYKSYRSHVWTDTDPDRCGTLPFVFEPGMGFERWVDWALDVPMYFVHRGGRYVDVAGQSFRKFMDGKLPGLPGERPTLSDWADHLTTVFPEVRLKRYIEQRGADGGPWHSICALPALWVGLLYDDDSLEAAADLAGDWSVDEIIELRAAVTRSGLHAPLPRRSVGITVDKVAREMVNIARRGLRARNRRDSRDRTEERFLSFLDITIERGGSPGRQKMELYDTAWKQDIDQLYSEFAF
ncbi:MAG TPA: glutamate--cysteine ligase [Kofleriaceae bacterium]|nr:glutamate--cysteine ligase [Kofleriaceae bacterium]